MLKIINYIFLVMGFAALVIKPVFAIDVLELNGKKFTYQLSSNKTHSFMPSNQKSNPEWKEKISIIYAPDVQNETGLESLASKLHHSYKNKGRVLKALKTDAEENNPSKFLLVTVMKGNDSVEAILTRMSLEDNLGTIFVYAHRFYGEEKSDELMAWFEKNGFRMEKEILEFKSIPSKTVFAESDE